MRKLFTFAGVISFGHQKPIIMATLNMLANQVKAPLLFGPAKWSRLKRQLRTIFYFEITTQKGKVWR